MIDYLYAEKVNAREVEVHVEVDGEERIIKMSLFMLLNDIGINND